MLTAKELERIIRDVIWYHSNLPRTPKKAFKKFDEKTPFSVHPILLGMQALHEESLPEELRVRIALALFGHDLLEDTTVEELPDWATNDPKVEAIIRGMTFAKGEDKYVEMWNRDESILLPELFDCVANLTCVGNRPPEKSERCKEAVRRLLYYIEPGYPRLDIIKMARGLLPIAI